MAVSILLINLASAIDSATINSGKQNECITLVQTCSDCSFVNLTSIVYPNSSKTIYSPHIRMTNYLPDFNYSFCLTNNVGSYTYTTLGDPEDTLTTQSVTFEITPSGFIQTTSQGITSAIVLFVVMISGGFLLFGGFKLLDNKDLWFFGTILLALGAVMMIYSLSLSIIYTRDLSYTSGTVGQQERIFRTTLRGVQILGIFTLPMLGYYFMNTYRNRKEEKSKNDGWDNNEY